MSIPQYTCSSLPSKQSRLPSHTDVFSTHLVPPSHTIKQPIKQEMKQMPHSWLIKELFRYKFPWLWFFFYLIHCLMFHLSNGKETGQSMGETNNNPQNADRPSKLRSERNMVEGKQEEHGGNPWPYAGCWRPSPLRPPSNMEGWHLADHGENPLPSVGCCQAIFLQAILFSSAGQTRQVIGGPLTLQNRVLSSLCAHGGLHYRWLIRH